MPTHTDHTTHTTFHQDTVSVIDTLMLSILQSLETQTLKIEFIKEEISSNRYTINSACIAAHFLEYGRSNSSTYADAKLCEVCNS